jgi:hypothetical protein
VVRVLQTTNLRISEPRSEIDPDIDINLER